MTCACKTYEVKIKMVQEQCLQLKLKFLLGHNRKIVISWEGNNLWCGNKTSWGSLLGGIFFWWENELFPTPSPQ